MSAEELSERVRVASTKRGDAIYVQGVACIVTDVQPSGVYVKPSWWAAMRLFVKELRCLRNSR